MKKCLLFIRVSTNRQELDSQLKETKEFAQSLGYDEFVVLKKTGASAFKVTDEYVEMLDEMKDTIEKDKDIKAVVVWAMNRLFRNDSIAVELKDWFVEKKIQLHIKEPRMTLLEEDGTLGDGNEMLFHFFAVFNKQQINELKAKSSRAKTRDKALHKYLGGIKIKFGYMVENGYLVPNPDEAKAVVDIYDLYATGGYSFSELAKEINQRYGTSLVKYRIAQILHSENYWNNKVCPAIITKAQFDAANKQMGESQQKPMGYKHKYFANRIYKCPQCGYGMTADSESYRCINRCKGNKSVAVAQMDGLLWLIASHLESERLLKSSSKDEYRQKQDVLQSKIKSMDKHTSKAEKTRIRAKEAYLNGVIELDEYQTRIAKVDEGIKDIQAKIDQWNSEIAELDRLIAEDGLSIQRILNIAGKIEQTDEEEMRNIVRKWVRQVGIDGNVVTVETLTRTYKAVYKAHNFYTKWWTIGDHKLVVRPIIRKDGDCSIGQTKLTAVDVPITVSWLGGSTIV